MSFLPLPCFMTGYRDKSKLHYQLKDVCAPIEFVIKFGCKKVFLYALHIKFTSVITTYSVSKVELFMLVHRLKFALEF